MVVVAVFGLRASVQTQALMALLVVLLAVVSVQKLVVLLVPELAQQWVLRKAEKVLLQSLVLVVP